MLSREDGVPCSVGTAGERFGPRCGECISDPSTSHVGGHRPWPVVQGRVDQHRDRNTKQHFRRIVPGLGGGQNIVACVCVCVSFGLLLVGKRQHINKIDRKAWRNTPGQSQADFVYVLCCLMCAPQGLINKVLLGQTLVLEMAIVKPGRS